MIQSNRKETTNEHTDSAGFAAGERQHGVDGRGIPQGGGGGGAHGDARRRVAQEDRGLHGLRLLPRQGQRRVRSAGRHAGALSAHRGGGGSCAGRADLLLHALRADPGADPAHLQHELNYFFLFWSSSFKELAFFSNIFTVSSSKSFFCVSNKFWALSKISSLFSKFSISYKHTA